MKPLNVQIEGLFNTFTHNIIPNQKERITIITTPNGYRNRQPQTKIKQGE